MRFTNFNEVELKEPCCRADKGRQDSEAVGHNHTRSGLFLQNYRVLVSRKIQCFLSVRLGYLSLFCSSFCRGPSFLQQGSNGFLAALELLPVEHLVNLLILDWSLFFWQVQRRAVAGVIITMNGQSWVHKSQNFEYQTDLFDINSSEPSSQEHVLEVKGLRLGRHS